MTLLRQVKILTVGALFFAGGASLANESCSTLMTETLQKLKPLLSTEGRDPLIEMKTVEEFRAWARTQRVLTPKILPYADYLANLSLDQRNRFFYQVKNLHIHRGNIISQDYAPAVLADAFEKTQGNLSKAMKLIETRYEEGLQQIQPLLREDYGRAFSHFKSKGLSEHLEQALCAKSIAQYDPNFSGFSEAERTQLESVLEQYPFLISEAYSGRNAMAKSIAIHEIRGGGSTGPIDDFVQIDRYRYDEWWSSSARGLAKITGATSRSPLMKMYGPRSRREIFWLRKSSSKLFDNLLDVELPAVVGDVHIAVNYDETGLARSLEVLARDENGRIQPFFYIRQPYMGTSLRWIPQTAFNGKPIEHACMECHGTPTGELLPRPKFLKTHEDLKKVGYQDDRLIEALLNLK